MVMPQYPMVNQYRWIAEEITSLTYEQLNTLWIHSAAPFCFLLWRALNELQQHELVKLFDAGQFAKLHFMWRGVADRGHTARIAEDRAAFLDCASVQTLLSFWGYMTGFERGNAIKYLEVEDAVSLFCALPRSSQIIMWKVLTNKNKAKAQEIWAAFSEEEQAEFNRIMTDFTVQLQSISVAGKCPLDPDDDIRENTFRAEYAELRKTADFVTISDMKARLKVSEQTIRNRATVYGYTIRKGDIHPPSSST